MGWFDDLCDYSSDPRVKEKVSIYRHAHDGQDPLNPKRNWMYLHTGESWPLECMNSLGAHVMSLVNGLLERFPEFNVCTSEMAS